MPEKAFTLSLLDGDFIRSAGYVGVYFERILDHPVQKVWEALTQPQELGKWLAPAIITPGPGSGSRGAGSITPVLGGTITLQLTGGTMGGRITRWKENILLEYAWHNGSTVCWELLHEGADRTRLLFTHCYVTKGQLVDAAKGWHYHLDVLALALDGKKAPDDAVLRWEAIAREAALRYMDALDKPAAAVDPFVIERVYNVPLERVWQALTDKEELKHWSFDIPDFEPEEDFEFTFRGQKDDKLFIHYCRVTEVVDRRKLSYSWRYENVTGISHVTWELFPEGGRTRLRLTHEGLEKMALAGPHFVRQNFMAGWTFYFDKSLVEWLQKTPAAVVL